MDDFESTGLKQTTLKEDKMKSFVQFLPILTALSLATCSSDKKKADPVPNTAGSAKGFKAPPAKLGKTDQYRPILEPEVPLALGAGVELENGTGITNKCLEGTVEKIPVQEGFLSLDAEYSRDEVESILTGDVGGEASGSWKGLSGQISARRSFSEKLIKNTSKFSYMVFAYNKHHSKIFTPTGRSAVSKDLTGADWFASCGTGYVAGADYGSMIMISFSLNLSKKEGVKETKTSADGGGNFWSFAKLRADISSNSFEKTVNQIGTLSVSVYQKGGKPEELGKILKGTKSEGGGGLIESFALCNVADTKACLEGLRGIENYLSEVFPAQIADTENGGAAVLSHYPFKYPNNIGQNVNPAYTADVAKARIDLANLHETEMQEALEMKAKARQDDNEAQGILTKMNNNVSEIRKAAKSCFKTEEYEKCVDAFDKLRMACAETKVPDYIKEGSTGGAGNKPVNPGE